MCMMTNNHQFKYENIIGHDEIKNGNTGAKGGLRNFHWVALDKISRNGTFINSLRLSAGKTHHLVCFMIYKTRHISIVIANINTTSFLIYIVTSLFKKAVSLILLMSRHMEIILSLEIWKDQQYHFDLNMLPVYWVCTEMICQIYSIAPTCVEVLFTVGMFATMLHAGKAVQRFQGSVILMWLVWMKIKYHDTFCCIALFSSSSLLDTCSTFTIL